ncbi:MAG: glycosyltransferase family 1 protein [Anaerolineae bacterium]|nr:glycosyltransferase family 1 protein [Anaerolineae bacterium]
MKILILTAGSRGDVQPFVALGRGLQTAGHEVTLATAALFESFVQGYGLNFAPMNDELLRLKDDPKLAMDGKGSKLALMKMVAPMLRRMLDDEWHIAQQGFDLLIYHPKTLGGIHIAEKLGVPAYLSLTAPLYTPTSAFTYPLLPQLNFGGWFNRLSYKLLNLIIAPYAGMINKWRAEMLGMPKRANMSELVRADNGQPTPILYSYSEQVIPRPADFPPHVHATGFWFLDNHSDWQPSAALTRFLESGKPPVYVGFGSMTTSDPRAKAKQVIEALRLSDQRGILASGWGGMKADDLPDNVFLLDEAPHEWLFPRMAAVVHHGGAGTTAAGLRAGKPALITPFIGDQSFWGTRLHMLGIAAKPIPQKRLTAENLSAALTQITSDPSLCREAERIGALIRAEDGVANAIRVIESRN